MGGALPKLIATASSPGTLMTEANNSSGQTTPTAQARSAQETNSPATDSLPSAPMPMDALVHDLTGIAFLSLPNALKAIVGDDKHKRLMSDIQDIGLELIIRHEQHVIFINLPIMAMTSGEVASLMDEGGVPNVPSAPDAPPTSKDKSDAGGDSER